MKPVVSGRQCGCDSAPPGAPASGGTHTTCPRGASPGDGGGYGAGTAGETTARTRAAWHPSLLQRRGGVRQLCDPRGDGHPQGTIRARYSPETCPALPQQLARLARGDTAAVLAFVRTYGLLGYAQVAAAVGRDTHNHAPGDPLAWIWAQAETVALCLLLTYGLQAGDDAALQHGLRVLQLPQPPHADGGPRLIVPAVWDQPGSTSAGRRLCTARRTGGRMPGIFGAKS